MMLQINQRIELDVNYGEYAGTYLSRVEEIGEKEIKVAIPVEKGTIVPLRLKTPVTITFLTKDAVHSGQTFIIGRTLHPIPVLILLMPEKFKRIQRRDYVRIEARLPVQVQIKENDEESMSLSACTANISGGGMMLVIQQEDLAIPLNSTLEVTIEIPEENQIIQAVGQVVRSQTIKSTINDNDELIIGIKFTLIEEKAREQIISYVFKRQRELRKLGLL